MQLGVDVVVVDYKTPDDLDGFCRSFAAFSGPRDRLHIVLVEPEDTDIKVARLWGPSAATIRQYDANIGYGQACNQGAKAALGARDARGVLGFFNADTRLTSGLLELCAGALLARPEWGVLGPRQVDDLDRFTAAGIVGTRDRPRHRGWQQPDAGQYSDIIEGCPTVSGSALFVRRPLWVELAACPEWTRACPEAAGPMQPSHYYSETLLCYHAQAHAGGRCVYFGPAKMVHRWHKASPVGGRVERAMPAEQARFRALCDAMHGGLPHD